MTEHLLSKRVAFHYEQYLLLIEFGSYFLEVSYLLRIKLMLDQFHQSESKSLSIALVQDYS